ncbi:MAG: hypothetical protein WD231_03055 [Candidatus Woykebacteria bacterium]
MVAHPSNEAEEVGDEGQVVDAKERRKFRERLIAAGGANNQTLVLVAQEELLKHPEWKPVVESVLRELGLQYLAEQIHCGAPAFAHS